jgi:hypothetical protein
MGGRAAAAAGGLRRAPALRRLRRRAAAILWIELLVRAAGPAILVMLLYAVLAVFGFGGSWLWLGSLILALAVLGFEVRRLRPPTASAIDRRIEAASGMAHRPLAVLGDSPATPGELSAAIWAAHVARTRATLTGARAGWPAPVAAARDPFSLRLLLLLLLATGMIAAGTDIWPRLTGAWTMPPWPFAGPTINAWITPPAYTGQGPTLLVPGQPVTVLRGTALSVILDGSRDAIRFGGAPLPGSVTGAESRRADTLITSSGTLTLGPWWHRLARFPITATPPAAPIISLDRVIPGPATARLAWHVQDPYGLASLSARLTPNGYPDALPESATLPAGDNKATLDLADSPYDGIEESLTLTAKNLAGMTARSAPQSLTLPPVPEHDATALLLRMIRQNLALTPAQAPAIARQLHNIAAAPPSAIGFAVDVQLAALAQGLSLRSTSPAGAVARLLGLIRQIDAGPDYAPRAALARSSQALLNALEHGPPDSATLQRLLAQMQQALAQHLQAIRPAADGAPAQHFDTSALDRMAAQIAADEQAGRLAKAQAELAQLANALQMLQNAKPMTAAQAAAAQAAASAAAGLTQLIQKQSGLLNQTAQGSATAAQQGQLRQDLQGVQATLETAGAAHLPGMQDAGTSMQAAQDALSQQNTGAAQSAEAGSIQNLQKAAAALQRAAQQSLTLGPGGSDSPAPDSDLPDGNSEDLQVPGLALPGSNPADAIEQEIMRLDANPNLPAATHQYLHRLLSPDQ